MLILGLCQLTEHTGERLEIMSEKKGTQRRERSKGGRGGMSSWQSDGGENAAETESNN